MEDKKPIYDDDKVKFIIKGLTEGKSRKNLSQKLEYSTYKSLDIYMRRKNFRWNSQNEMYEPLVEEKKDTHIPSSSKVMEIISLLSKEGNDPKSVAKRLNFKSHIDMADYLKAKGYVYDGDKKNYIKQTGKIETEIEQVEKDNEVNLAITEENEISTLEHMVGIDEYLPVLDILVKNKEKLIDLLTPQLLTGEIPRYAIGGTFTTKSVHMRVNLDYTIRSFSIERGIKQKDIFEVALIEFFKRYGYEAEVESLLD